MASGIYNRAKANLMNKEMDLEGDTINVMLLTSSHAFTATHNQKSEIVANEVSGTGYDAGGKALAGKGVTQAATTKWDATDATWASSTITAAFAVIFDDTLANDDLIACIDFGGDKSSSAGDFKIQWHADGIITLA